ncbi:hypothetical protein FHS96_003075 [Sphingomonas zeicaulis]
MANIFAILPGLSLTEMNAMGLAELMAWHERARARAEKK